MKRIYPTEQIERFEDDLGADHFAILMLASASDYAGLAQTLGLPLGTVKSRLNRARAAIDKLIDNDNERAYQDQQDKLMQDGPGPSLIEQQQAARRLK